MTKKNPFYEQNRFQMKIKKQRLNHRMGLYYIPILNI